MVTNSREAWKSPLSFTLGTNKLIYKCLFTKQENMSTHSRINLSASQNNDAHNIQVACSKIPH